MTALAWPIAAVVIALLFLVAVVRVVEMVVHLDRRVSLQRELVASVRELEKSAARKQDLVELADRITKVEKWDRE